MNEKDNPKYGGIEELPIGLACNDSSRGRQYINGGFVNWTLVQQNDTTKLMR